MSRAAPPSARLERGEITWVGVLLLLLVFGGAYLGYMWLPVYMDHYEAKRLVHGQINEAVKKADDRALVEALCQKLAAIGTEEWLAQDGKLRRGPKVDVRPQDVTWERDRASTPPQVHAAFEYVRVVRYPWTDRYAEKTFTVDITQDIAIPRW
jgi:hypothetical protein